MDSKTKGVLLGIGGAVLWFMPLVDFGFMGLKLYEAGPEVGRIAYLLLAASLAYSVFSWFEQHQLRVISAGIATGISLLLLVDFGSKAAWGLYLLIVVSGVSCIAGYTDEQKRRKPLQNPQT